MIKNVIVLLNAVGPNRLEGTGRLAAIIPPTRSRNFPYSFFFRYFGTITTWYLQSHLTCDKLCQSCIGSSSNPSHVELYRRKNLFYFTLDR
jgi:hypothetical protein